MVDIAIKGTEKENRLKIKINEITVGDMHRSPNNKRIKSIISSSFITAFTINSTWEEANKNNIVIGIPTETICSLNKITGVDRYYVESACRITYAVSQCHDLRSGEMKPESFCKKVRDNIHKDPKQIYTENDNKSKIADENIKAIETLLLDGKPPSLIKAVLDLLSCGKFIEFIMCIVDSFDPNRLGCYIRIDSELSNDLKESLGIDKRCEGWCSIMDAFKTFDPFLKMDSTQIVINKIIRSIRDSKVIVGDAADNYLSDKDNAIYQIMRFTAFINAVSKSLDIDEIRDCYSMKIDSDVLRDMVGMERTSVVKEGLMIFSHNAKLLAEKIASEYCNKDFDISEYKIFSLLKSDNILLAYANFSNLSTLSLKSRLMLDKMGSALPYRCILDTDPLSDTDMEKAIEYIKDGLSLRRPEEIMVYDDDVRNAGIRTIFESKICTIIPHWFDNDNSNELLEIIKDDVGFSRLEKSIVDSF